MPTGKKALGKEFKKYFALPSAVHGALSKIFFKKIFFLCRVPCRGKIFKKKNFFLCGVSGG
jgi:hypothetical protein